MIHGLREQDVGRLQQKFGKNLLPLAGQAAWPTILWAQFKSSLVYVLSSVAIISLFLERYFDAILIAGVILVDVLMGFFQEYNAKKTLDALKKILHHTVQVVRDGQQRTIAAQELVPGDMVLLAAGDRIPADGALVEGSQFIVHEAILTGEEEAIPKTIHAGHNALFMGTTVLSGRGVMHVDKIGLATQMGAIGKSLAEIKETKTPIQHKLERFSKNLALLVLVLCAGIFFLGILNHENSLEMFKMAVILSLAAIPQGLPIAVTMILAIGMRRILKKHALVKSLVSLETLGATSVICTDKTGTLTFGIMKVVKEQFFDEYHALLGLTLNNLRKSGLEIALWEFVQRKKIFDPEHMLRSVTRVYEEPFDGEKKYSLTINVLDGRRIAFIVGAPEIVLAFCTVSAEQKKNILRDMHNWAVDGLRIIGVAYKNIEALGENETLEKRDFMWAGLLGVADPVRPEARETLLAAQRAGIHVKIVTGDYLVTAERVAHHLGFRLGTGSSMQGAELEMMNDQELKKRISDIVVFARVTPHQKQKVIQVLQDNGEIVAMTGDGVNDAPALKKADIGIALASACDVAQEAADLVLLDNNFKTIVDACQEGRLIFANIKKTVGYMLSNSFSEIVIVFGAFLLKFPVPLTVAQILWTKIICDGPPDLALAFEPEQEPLLKQRPHTIKHEEILNPLTKSLIVLVSGTAGLLSLALFWFFAVKQTQLMLGQTIAFATLASVDMFYIFSYRNLKQTIFNTKNFFQNPVLFFAVAYGFVLLACAVYIPFLNKILGTVPLRLTHWALVLFVACITMCLVEVIKKFFGNSIDNLNN